jgi:hypothetical protein
MLSSATLAGRSAAPAWLAPLFLCLAAGLLYTINLDKLPNPDELHHVIAARGLLEDGQPRIAEGLYTRGLLYTWMVAGSYALFGDSLAVARLPSVLCMALLAAVIFVWVRREANALAAWIGAGLFAVSPFAVDMAQFSRFYAPQCLGFFLGMALLYEAIGTPGGWGRRALLAALALPPLLIALHFQPTTLIGLMGLALWAAGTVGLPWLMEDGEAGRRKRLAFAGLVALGLVLLAGLWLSGTLAGLWHRYRWTPLFNQDVQDQFWYYHAWYSLLYPSLWPLTGVLALVAVAAWPRPAGFSLVVFATAFLLNSVAAAKNLRYLVYAQPFLFALWGMALASLWPPLQAFARRLRQGLVGPLESVAPGLGRLAGALLGAALLFLLLANPAWLRTASLLGDFTVPPEQPSPDWPAVADELAPWLQRADIVVTTEELATLYYLGRYDVRFSRSKLDELPDAEQRQFGIDHRTGRPVVSTTESLERILACYPSGVILGPQASWNNRLLLDQEQTRLIQARAEPIPLPRGAHIFAYRWQHPAGFVPAPICADLPRFSVRGGA